MLPELQLGLFRTSPNETYCTAVKIGKLPMGMAVPLIALHMFWITFK